MKSTTVNPEIDATVALDRARTFACPGCGARLLVADVPAGTRVLCGGCGAGSVLPAAPDTRRTSRKAIASLACGVGACLFSCVTGVPAVILGWLALRDLRLAPQRLKGRGLALTGIWLGFIVPLLCGPVHIAFILPAVQAARHAGPATAPRQDAARNAGAKDAPHPSP
jgi:ribosomal protein S27AE